MAQTKIMAFVALVSLATVTTAISVDGTRKVSAQAAMQAGKSKNCNDWGNEILHHLLHDYKHSTTCQEWAVEECKFNDNIEHVCKVEGMVKRKTANHFGSDLGPRICATGGCDKYDCCRPKNKDDQDSSKPEMCTVHKACTTRHGMPKLALPDDPDPKTIHVSTFHMITNHKKCPVGGCNQDDCCML